MGLTELCKISTRKNWLFSAKTFFLNLIFWILVLILSSTCCGKYIIFSTEMHSLDENIQMEIASLIPAIATCRTHFGIHHCVMHNHWFYESILERKTKRFARLVVRYIKWEKYLSFNMISISLAPTTTFYASVVFNLDIVGKFSPHFAFWAQFLHLTILDKVVRVSSKWKVSF